MKQKLQRWIPSALIGLALSTSVGFSSPVITVSTFDDATPVNNNMWTWYGGSSFSFDAAVDHTGNAGGSLHISQPSSAGADTIIVPETFTGGGAWWGPTVNLTVYTNVSVWFKWDTTSSMPLSTFNTEGTGGFDIALVDNTTWDAPGRHFLPSAQIPNAASNGWVHLNFPVSPTIPNINQIVAVLYYDWKPSPWSGTVKFWVDDVTFEPAATDVIPPPILSPLVKKAQGLNVFASTGGNNYWDRQEGELIQTTGLGWIGHATTGNPVSYSFTVADFPNVVDGAEAYLFLSPNPAGNESAPDWNEANCVVAYVQLDSTAGGAAIMHFQYKVNNAGDNRMYAPNNNPPNDYTNAPGSWDGVTSPWHETGNIGSVTNPTALGTWTVRFTSNTNVTLIAPSGTQTHCVIPAYNIGYLGEGGNGMNVYLGMQANNAASMNKAVVYSNFAISGSGTPFSENFLTDTVLDTTNIWRTSVAAGSAGVLIVPASAAYWLSWTLPDGGFSSEISPSLTNPLGWTSTAGTKIAMNGIRSQLIGSSSLPPENAAFLRLVKRVFTKLQILLPGMTAAPNTENGYTGTPTAQSGFTPFDVIVNSVDNNWNLVNGAADTIHLTSTDGNFFVVNDPTDLALSGGTATFSVEMLGDGSGTITATDVTDGSKTAATSPTVTY